MGTLDRHMMESPLRSIPANELPMAATYRRLNGLLDETELAEAVIVHIARAVAQRDTPAMLALINAIDAVSGQKISGRAVGVGTVPNPDDSADTLLVFLGDGGQPLRDHSGETMAYSLKGINAIALGQHPINQDSADSDSARTPERFHAERGGLYPVV